MEPHDTPKTIDLTHFHGWPSKSLKSWIKGVTINVPHTCTTTERLPNQSANSNCGNGYQQEDSGKSNAGFHVSASCFAARLSFPAMKSPKGRCCWMMPAVLCRLATWLQLIKRSHFSTWIWFQPESITLAWLFMLVSSSALFSFTWRSSCSLPGPRSGTPPSQFEGNVC